MKTLNEVDSFGVPRHIYELAKDTYRYCPDTGVFFGKKGKPLRPDKGGYVLLQHLKCSHTSKEYTVKAHRVAWFITYGNLPVDLIDHINGDRSYNRAANLRESCTKTNAQNRKVNTSKTGKYKGSYRCYTNGSKNPWKAAILVEGGSKHLGCYPSEEKAALAYDKAARVHHREFAKLNFPEITEYD